MTRIKLTIASALTTAMILGSTIAFASTPASDEANTTIDAATDTTEMLKAKPGGRRGGAGFHLRK